MTEYSYFFLFGALQLAHSQEEIWTGFHKRWFVFKMPRPLFVAFEVVLSTSILAYMICPTLPFANIYMPAFMFAMLLNGMEHIIWAAVERRYVPGLVTAPLFVVLFAFYFAHLIKLTQG